MGNVINFPGVEKTIRTIDYERAHAVSEFKARTDSKVLDVEIYSVLSRTTLALFMVHWAALAVGMLMLGVGITDGELLSVVIGAISILINAVCIIIHFRTMSKDLKEAENICHSHVFDNNIFDDEGNLKKW